MEHAQRDTLIKNESVVYGSLNPYFNGTCSKSGTLPVIVGQNADVLILILMEHAQRARFIVCISSWSVVLILVLMEHAQRVNRTIMKLSEFMQS